MLSMVFCSNYWIPAERVNIKCALVFGQCWLIFIWKHFLLLLLFSSSGLIGFVKRISKWNLQLVLYIILLWMQNYSCPDKKRWIGRWSMRTMAKDEAQGEAQEAEAMGWWPQHWSLEDQQVLPVLEWNRNAWSQLLLHSLSSIQWSNPT